MATKKMLECHIISAIVTVDSKPIGILTSKDILMRVISLGLGPESTIVEKVMTPNPECANIDTPIVDALHTMHHGKFLHLHVVDREGLVVAIIDVLHISHAAVASVGSTAGIDNEAASTMMQKFWDSAMASAPADDDSDSRRSDDLFNSENSFKLASETEIGKVIQYPSPTLPNTFAFKIQDRKGRMHRFICDTHSLTDLITAIVQRVGGEIDRNNLPQILDMMVAERDAQTQAGETLVDEAEILKNVLGERRGHTKGVGRKLNAVSRYPNFFKQQSAERDETNKNLLEMQKQIVEMPSSQPPSETSNNED
ncbi:hypothetical protein LXL04_031693 [Taraxacum kok-saghyz]